MSGKPTMSGAQAVLEYFRVPEAEVRIEQYGKRKQQIVDEPKNGGSKSSASRRFEAVRSDRSG